VFDQQGDDFVGGRAGGAVVVVQDQHQRLLRAADRAQQCGAGGGGVQFAPVGQAQRQGAVVEGAQSQRQRQVGEQARRFGIALVQRQPGDLGLAGRQQVRVPLRQQGGLAEARWRQQQGQRQGDAGIEGLEQARARYRVHVQARRLELVRQDPVRRDGPFAQGEGTRSDQCDGFCSRHVRLR